MLSFLRSDDTRTQPRKKRNSKGGGEDLGKERKENGELRRKGQGKEDDGMIEIRKEDERNKSY